MGLVLLILLIGVPIAEIAVFIQAGNILGFWLTLTIIVLTAMIGTFFLRLQGIGVLSRIIQSVQNNILPLGEMFDGLGLLFAGALLLTPGFITDGVGFALLIPPIRRALAATIVRYLVRSGRVNESSGFSQDAGMGNGPVIDGDYREINDQDKRLADDRSGDDGPDNNQADSSR